MGNQHIWERVENNLQAIVNAGIQRVGEKLPRLPCGGPSKEEVLREYQRAERIREWALSCKRGKP
jgi:hypothetical protein